MLIVLGLVVVGFYVATYFPVQNKNGKVIYLTFDGDMTYHMLSQQKSGLVKRWYDPDLFSYLEQNHIPATFFITGLFAQTYPYVLRELAKNKDFSIQNHTYDHSSFQPKCFNLPTLKTDQQKKDEITKTQKILSTFIGHNPEYLRYPGLCHNNHDDDIARMFSLKILPKEIPSGDAFLKNPDAIAKNVVSHLKQGNVFVFHLGDSKTPATLAAIKILIPELKKAGYSFGHL